MDSSNLKLEERRLAVTGRWQVLALTGLILAALLTATVGVIIYIALHPGATCGAKRHEPADFKETVHIKESGSKGSDVDLMYNSKENIALLVDEDGNFNLHDYSKGLHITKDLASGICYVTPSSQSAHEGLVLKKHFQDRKSNVTLEPMEVSVNILPGKISDISFIPEEANDYCFNGYQWMLTSPATPSSGIVKRRTQPVRRIIIIVVIVIVKE